MKKVGIMTWYKYDNYGTVLQAYALSYTLKQLNCNPLFVNYHPRKAVEGIVNKKLILKKIKVVISDFIYQKYYSADRIKLYDEFRKIHIKETKPCNNYPELHALNDIFDGFVCGSDQIWSPSVFDEKYFLSFVDDDAKKIAYAPSLGLTKITDESIKKQIKKLVSLFGHVSVREQQGAELLKSLIGKDIQVVLDPTLLLNTQNWNALLEKSDFEDKELGDYLLCYFLNPDYKYQIEVRRLAKKFNLKIISIPMYKQCVLGKVPFEVGPLEFISLIKNAKYVCTDSFHGMAFSINYNVPFSAFLRFGDKNPNNQNSRVLSLLNLLSLEDRIYSSVHVSNAIGLEDFREVNKKLELFRKLSVQFLEEAIEEIGNSKDCHNGQWKNKITDICCGCGMCAAACPQKAITMKESEAGFQDAEINKDLCIACGICEKVCPFHNVNAKNLNEISKLYAFKNLDFGVLRKSSSGGAAYSFYKYALAQNMDVYGVVYHAQSKRAICVRGKDMEDIESFQGSKYIQADMLAAFEEIVKNSKNKKVLYIGTPCQNAALNNWLVFNKKREDFLLVDLICHGVPTINLWKKYIKYLDERYHTGKEPKVIFRDKEKGWRKRFINITEGEKNYIENEKKDIFYSFFRYGICNRKACFECPYRDKASSDIRIADYWGTRFLKDKEGVSMVIPVTHQGESFFNGVMKKLNVVGTEYSMEDFWNVQYPYNMPMPLFYEQLLKELADDETQLENLRSEYCRGLEVQEKIVFFLDKIR